MKPGKEELEQYLLKRFSTHKIAKITGISQPVISRMCKNFGIKSLCRSGPRGSIELNNCGWCKTKLKKLRKKYCNSECFQLYKYNNIISKWKNGTLPPRDNYNVSSSIRRYLFEKWNSKCQLCGWSQINSYTNKVPLEIDHIDGNWKDFSETNLRLLCPNCHSLTPFHKALNKGRGRVPIKFKK